jgi:hypothetical protein
VVKTKVISDINAYQTYIDALDNPYTRKNYEIHFSEFKKALKAESCNELLEMDGGGITYSSSSFIIRTKSLVDNGFLMIHSSSLSGAYLRNSSLYTSNAEMKHALIPLSCFIIS